MSRRRKTERLEVYLLGKFEVKVGHRRVANYTGQVSKPWVLLSLLALAPDHRLSVEQACDLLWPEARDARRHVSLNVAVHHLRRALDATRPGPASPYLGRDDEALWLCPGAYLRLDVKVFEAAARAAADARDPAVFERATKLYTGDLRLLEPCLPGTEHLRKRLHDLYVETLIRYAALFMDLGRVPEAQAIQRRITREVETHAMIAPHGQAPPAAGPRVAPRPLTNIGVTRRHLIGREQELKAIREFLPHWRLITLHGPAGVGKTALAEEAASQFCSADSDYEAIWEVPLDQLAKGEGVATRVGRVLGIQAPDGAGVIEPERIAAALEHRRVLLVFDTCEHVRPKVAALCLYLLNRCPRVHILATSRYPLHLPHGQERLLPVPPLGVPLCDHTDAKRVGRAQAVQCFLQLAERHGAGFQLTDAEAAAVAAICRHVGGIPLALELVSALLISKRPSQLALELDGLLELPNGAWGSAPPHQRTLRKSLEWSVRRLTRAQRCFLTRLAIFSGGWTQRAAEEVCAGEDIALSKVGALLRELRDWSLISIEQMGMETRYTMLTLTQQYLRGRLASDADYAPLQRRHAEWCARFAEAEGDQLEGAAQIAALRRLDWAWGNLRAALEWAIAAEQPVLALRLVAALWRYWWIRGWFGEGIALIQRTLRLCAPSLLAERPVALHYARALAALGILLAEQGDRPPAARTGDSPAEERMRESLALLRTLDDEHALAATLSLAGMVAYWAEQHDAARFYLHESLRRRRRLGDRAGIADCQKNLGTLAYYQHRYGLAERRLTACLRTRRQLGDSVGMAYAQINLANVAFQCGQYETAEAYYLESLAWRWVLDARGGIASCLAGLFVNAADRGLPLRAAWLAGVETELKRALGTQLSPTDQRLCDERLEACRQRAGDAAFAAAQARGAACPLDLALACLLTAMDPAVDAAEAAHPFTALRAHLGQRLTVTQREIAWHLSAGESLAPIQARRHIKKADFDAELSKIPAKVRAALEAYAEPPDRLGGSSQEVSYS